MPRKTTALLALACLFGGTVLAAQQVAHLPAEDEWLDADFEEVYRVGSIAGEDWEQFGKIAATGFDAAGNLYVLDPQASRVVVVAPDGSHLHTYGREGDGPGEFRQAARMLVMADGRTMIFDRRHSAFLAFDADGEYVRSVRMPGGTLMASVPELDPAGDAAVPNGVVTAMSFASLAGGGDSPAQNRRPVTRLILSGAEVVKDTLAFAWQAAPEMRPPMGRTTIWGGGRVPAFAPKLFVGALHDGGVVFSDSSDYRLKTTDTDGAVVRVLMRPFPPQPVTDRMRDAERVRMRAEHDQQELDIPADIPDRAKTLVGQLLDGMRAEVEDWPFFPEVSVIRDLQTDWLGRIWVRRTGNDPFTDGPLDVLSADGAYFGSFRTGTLPMPVAFGPDGLAAFIETDEYGVESVVVLRLSRLAPMVPGRPDISAVRSR